MRKSGKVLLVIAIAAYVATLVLMLMAPPAHAEDVPVDTTSETLTDETATDAPASTESNALPTLKASFVSFCDTILLLNEGDVTLTFFLGASKGGGVDVSPGSLEVPADYGSDNQTEIEAWYGNVPVFNGVAKPSPEHCTLAEPVAPKVTVWYECGTRGATPEDSIGLVKGTLDPGSYTPVSWVLQVTYPDGDAGKKAGNWTPITIDRYALPIGTYNWTAHINSNDHAGGSQEGTFEVKELCVALEPPAPTTTVPPTVPPTEINEPIPMPEGTVTAAYTCATRSATPADRTANLTFTFVQNPATIATWNVNFGGEVYTSATRDPITVNLPALVLGAHPYRVNATATNGIKGKLETSFRVTDACAVPEQRVIETMASCLTFMVKNAGNVPTSGKLYGVTVHVGTQSPVVLDLQPGQSKVFEVPAGLNVSVIADNFQVRGPEHHSSIVCLPEGLVPTATVELTCVPSQQGVYEINSFKHNLPSGYVAHVVAPNEFTMPETYDEGDRVINTVLQITVEGTRSVWPISESNVTIVCLIDPPVPANATPPSTVAPPASIPMPMGELPATGSGSTLLAVIASAVLTLGAGMLLIGHRRSAVA